VTAAAEADPDDRQDYDYLWGEGFRRQMRELDEVFAMMDAPDEHPVEPSPAPIASDIAPALPADPGSELAVAPLEAEPPPPAMARPDDLVELPAPPAMAPGLAEVLGDPGPKAIPSSPSAPSPAPPRPAPWPMASPPAAAQPKAGPDLHPGQAEWLATLPAEKRATFDGLSPGRKAMVLGRRPHGVCTDPMLLRMEEADLAPRQPVAIPKPILTIEDAVEAIVGGYRPATSALATLLAREFDDQKSWPFFDQVGGLLMENPSRADDFLDALRQARNPKAKNPGAILVTVLKRDHGWEFKRP
jgi:hypothetical protein